MNRKRNIFQEKKKKLNENENEAEGKNEADRVIEGYEDMVLYVVRTYVQRTLVFS